MNIKQKKKSTLMKKATYSMGSNGQIEFDIYVQPKSRKYVLWKDARDVAYQLEGRIEELSDLLLECFRHIGDSFDDKVLKEKIKREIKMRDSVEPERGVKGKEG